jgi:hypothetical protein
MYNHMSVYLRVSGASVQSLRRCRRERAPVRHWRRPRAHAQTLHRASRVVRVHCSFPLRCRPHSPTRRRRQTAATAASRAASSCRLLNKQSIRQMLFNRQCERHTHHVAHRPAIDPPISLDYLADIESIAMIRIVAATASHPRGQRNAQQNSKFFFFFFFSCRFPATRPTKRSPRSNRTLLANRRI